MAPGSVSDQAIEMALEQGVLFWELRVGLEPCPAFARAGRSADAMGILQPVHNRFTEACDTAGLRAATASRRPTLIQQAATRIFTPHADLRGALRGDSGRGETCSSGAVLYTFSSRSVQPDS